MSSAETLGGAPRGDCRHRERRASRHRARSGGGHALPGRAVSPLSLPEVHRRPAGVRARVRRRVLRRRSRQLHLPALLPRHDAVARLRQRQAARRRRTTCRGRRPASRTATPSSRRDIPAPTQRLNTVAHLEFLRDHALPLSIDAFTTMRNALDAYSKQGAEQRRQANDDFFGIENSLKSWQGPDRRAEGSGAAEQEARGRTGAARSGQRQSGAEGAGTATPGIRSPPPAATCCPTTSSACSSRAALGPVHAVLHASPGRSCAGPTRARSPTASGCPSTPTRASRSSSGRWHRPRRSIRASSRPSWRPASR